jgi:hypothetical protein
LPPTTRNFVAEGAMYFDLFRAAYQVFIDLGVPPPAILEQHAAALEDAIETTSSPVPAEPEPAKESDSPSDNVTDLLKPDPPAEPEPGDRNFTNRSDRCS